MQRGRLLHLGVGAVALVAAVALLRSQTPTVESVVAPDGEQFSAYHDPRRITPPSRPDAPPRPPGELQLDSRRNGTLVSWPPAPFGFEVRWGRAGGELNRISYHATAGTTLRDLKPGRYRVEVRSVDSIGQRSTPVSAEFEASGSRQDWMRGLGFTADFGLDPALDPMRWRLSDAERRCVRTDGEPDPVLLMPASCGFGLRPAAPLVLGKPDRHGVRGRVVVVTDAPQSERLGSELAIVASPSPTTSFSFVDPAITDGSAHRRYGLPSHAIAMRVTGLGVGFELGADVPAEESDSGTYRPPETGTASPGALHRWELVFRTDRIEAYRNGDLVASAAVTAPWRQALVNITTGYDAFGGTRTRSAAQVAFVGLTGELTDRRPVLVLDVDPGGSVERTEGAVSARLTAIAGRRLRATPEQLVANVESPPGSPQVAVHLQPLDTARSAAYAADLPAELLGEQLWISLRAPESEVFFERLVLELTYPEGTDLGVSRPQPEPRPPALPRLVLQLRSPATGSVLSEDQRTTPAEHPARLAVYGRASSNGMVPWIAVVVELDGRRILTMPTALAGPAIASQYEFTLDLGDVPDGSHVLAVSLIPDRAGSEPATAQTRFRIQR